VVAVSFSLSTDDWKQNLLPFKRYGHRLRKSSCHGLVGIKK